MEKKATLLSGALFGGTGVALGAFGAHALKPVLLANNRLEVYETAVRYQMVHALALLAVGVMMTQFPTAVQLRWTSWCWVGGIILFSGSLYALSFTSITAFAFITPVGGFLFLAGWGLLVLGIVKIRQ